MTNPIQVDLPHKLGAEEARRRIDGGIGKLKDFIPGGGDVRSAWTGNRLGLQVAAMGQEVSAQLDVRDTFVRVELLLPPSLAFFRPAVEAALRNRGGAMLEDRAASRSD
jgi:putative polyhydroxyalkanoic acid system protein